MGQKYGSEKKDEYVPPKQEGENTNFTIKDGKIYDGDSVYEITDKPKGEKWNIGKNAPKGYTLYANFDADKHMIGNKIWAVKNKSEETKQEDYKTKKDRLVKEAKELIGQKMKKENTNNKELDTKIKEKWSEINKLISANKTNKKQTSNEEDDFEDITAGSVINWKGQKHTVMSVNKKNMTAVLDTGETINWDVEVE